MNDSVLFENFGKINIVLWTTLSMLSTILGTLLNGYTLFVLFRVKALRRPHYILIAGVTLSDLLCDAIFIPIEVLQSYYRIRFFTLLGNDFFCVFEGCGFAICFSASMLGQMLVAINRWLAVYAPVFFQRHINIRVAVIAWLLLGLGFPSFYYIVGYLAKWVSFPIDLQFGDCKEQDTPNLKTVRVTLNTYFPCALGLVLYFLILLRVLSSRTKEQRRNAAKRARGSLAMFVNMVIYACCVLPLWISFGTNTYTGAMKKSLGLKFVFRLSYAVNPVSNTLFYMNTLIFTFEGIVRKLQTKHFIMILIYFYQAKL